MLMYQAPNTLHWIRMTLRQKFIPKPQESDDIERPRSHFSAPRLRFREPPSLSFQVVGQQNIASFCLCPCQNVRPLIHPVHLISGGILPPMRVTSRLTCRVLSRLSSSRPDAHDVKIREPVGRFPTNTANALSDPSNLASDSVCSSSSSMARTISRAIVSIYSLDAVDSGEVKSFFR